MFQRSTFVSQNWAILLCVCLSLASTSSYAAWQARLSDTQVQTLNLVAINHFNTEQLTTQKSSSSLRSNKLKPHTTELGLQVLLIELQETKSRTANEPRLAETFVFDYTTDTASVMLIEVENQRVVSTTNINDIHLPLNEREVSFAAQVLLNNAALMKALSAEYEKQFGKPLVSLSQLDMKVSIWHPGNHGHQEQDCIHTRCALVSLFTKNHYNFSVEPIVNLSTSTVNLDWVQ